MIGVYLHLGAMTEAQYHEVDDAVAAAGVNTDACKLHTCFKEGDRLAVFDIWESREAFEAFAAELGPIAAANGFTEMPDTSFVEMVAFQTR